MKKVVLESEGVVSVNQLSASKGYVMRGTKGDYILSQNGRGDYNWVRLTPPSLLSEPCNAYSSFKAAVLDKLIDGYEVFEYTTAHVE